MSTIFYATDGHNTSIVKDVTDLVPGDYLDGSNSTVIDLPRTNQGIVTVSVRCNRTGRVSMLQYAVGEYELVTSPLLI